MEIGVFPVVTDTEMASIASFCGWFLATYA